MSNKKYGLIVPGSNKVVKPTFEATRNVFGDESDSEDDAKKKPVLLQPSHNINRQAKISQEKALKEDPTVYQYDEVYESMTTQKEEVKNKNKQDKKPRYIENLLKTANKRKIENERRIERQVQKEREKEGDEFADKEVFVTSAYKKKLEEMRLEEEKEKREEYLESIGDVTKQRDLGGFYRHLYEQKLGSEKMANPEHKKDDETDKKTIEDRSQTPEPTELFKKNASKHVPVDKEVSKRNYRKRQSSNSANRNMSEGEIEDSDDEINRVNISEMRQAKKSKTQEDNIDADSDFSIDDSSDEEDGTKTVDKNDMKDTIKSSKKPNRPETPAIPENNVKDETITETKLEPIVPKTKIDIWKKRTVGDVFEQALQRYYERKSARGY